MNARSHSGVRSIARFLTATTVAAFLLLVPLRVHAQQHPPAVRTPLTVHLATVGTFGLVRPYADVVTSDPAYVAVFEVEPDVGAVMLWPYTNGRARFVENRHVEVGLSGPPVTLYRQEFRDRLRSRFLLASHVRPEAYLVAIASRRPLQLSGLLGGRIYRYEGGFASAYTVARALVERVAPGPRADRDYDIITFLKGRDPTLALALGRYVPLDEAGFASACIAAGQLGYYTGLGIYSTPWIDCGGAFNGYDYGWWQPWYWGPTGNPVAYAPPYGPRRRSTPVMKTDSLRVGYPQLRSHPEVTSKKTPAKAAAKKASVKAANADPTRIRDLLERLADATTAAPVDPNIFVRDRQAFGLMGIGDPGKLASEVTDQGTAAGSRLERRLRQLGVPAHQARSAARTAGPAPRIEFRGGRAAIGGTPSTSAPSRPEGTRRSRGVPTPSRSGHVSRPARPAPRAPVRVWRPAVRHSAPVRPRRPASSSSHKGGGGPGH